MQNSGNAAQRSSQSNWDYRYGLVNCPALQPHPDDRSLMTYRGHQITQTLIRAYFSPIETTGQKYIYTGSSDGCIYGT